MVSKEWCKERTYNGTRYRKLHPAGSYVAGVLNMKGIASAIEQGRSWGPELTLPSHVLMTWEDWLVEEKRRKVEKVAAQILLEVRRKQEQVEKKTIKERAEVHGLDVDFGQYNVSLSCEDFIKLLDRLDCLKDEASLSEDLRSIK